MSESYNFGREGEQKAIEYLLINGYEILEKNFFFQKAEIDIIAKKDSKIIIIEVKSRSYNTIQEPFEAVNFKKKQLLIKAANNYIEKNNLDFETQFDIISIVKNKTSIKINHIKNAFDVV